MTKDVLKIGLLSVILIGTFSCKNKENELAEKRISDLEAYVDSLKSVPAEDLEKNWDQITMNYSQKNAEASEAISSIDEKSQADSKVRLEASEVEFDQFKNVTEKRVEQKAGVNQNAKNPSQLLRDRLFGAGKIGNDMSFAWVNKDNILGVYEQFFESYKENKGDFSREDYDEIKLMYEALDSRKNTVEKEGLSGSDNAKIASIKFKFAPMLKVNRMGAKARETSEAKQ